MTLGISAAGHRALRACLLSLVAWIAILAAGGCSQQMPDRAQRMTRGYIWYLDGAGGGGAVSNWSGGLREGLLAAGYDGAGEIYPWNTGLGVVPDQDSSIEYKRGKAADCARRVVEYKTAHPDAGITLIGLSAGTAVTVFVLEALPSSCQVDSVILCGASIASDYDLTTALQRVRNRMYVYTSDHDAVLSFLVPMAGTADREAGDVPSAGLHGFVMPHRASAETRNQYAKVAYIPWRSEFEQYGDFGGHTDALKGPFVQHYMAPLIMSGMARKPDGAPAAGTVLNPDYERWSRFGVGSYVTYEGYQEVGQTREPIRMTARLVSKHEDRLLVERSYASPDQPAVPFRVHNLIVDARIKPGSHPLTDPASRITEQPQQTLTVQGKELACHVCSVTGGGPFPEYGRDISATICRNDSLPGGMARVWLRSRRGDQPFEFRGEAVAYAVR